MKKNIKERIKRFKGKDPELNKLLEILEGAVSILRDYAPGGLSGMTAAVFLARIGEPVPKSLVGLVGKAWATKREIKEYDLELDSDLD